MFKFVGSVLDVIIAVGLLLVVGVPLFVVFFPWSLIALLAYSAWKGLRALERRRRERKSSKVIYITETYRF